MMEKSGAISLTGLKITIIGKDKVGVSSAKTDVTGSAEAKFGTGSQNVTTDQAKTAISGAASIRPQGHARDYRRGREDQLRPCLMRQMVERSGRGSRTFIGQREDLVLVLGARNPTARLVSKVIEGQDESSTSELYWTVIDAFDDAPSFVDACVRSFATKHEAVRLALQQQSSQRWPPLPGVADPALSLPPVERLNS